MYSLGERLRELRNSRGYSQEELADKLNEKFGSTVNKGMISKWENDLGDPRLEHIRNLAIFYNVPLDDLLGLNQSETRIPEWATAKDFRDFKKMLQEDAPVMFDGVPIEGEARQRVLDVLTGLFWEAKELNKKTYGRKKKNESTDDNQ